MATSIRENAARQYRKLRSELVQQFPAAAAMATQLASEIVDPRTADPDRMWSVIWDKPLYANTRVSSADRTKDLLKDGMESAWKMMADPDGMYAMSHIAPGSKKSSFDVRGERAKEIIERHRIARHRLFAIVGAGHALAARSDAIEITQLVRSLAEDAMGESSPYALREIDKTLMEISKNKLISKVE